MDKSLDMVALLQRLILGVAVALAAIGLSIHRPSKLYDEAEEEIGTLGDAISAVTDQVTHVFKLIYGNSELKASTLAWLAARGAPQKDVPITVVLTGNLSVPDANVDPLVTLDSQVKWVDRIYLDDDNPFYLCSVQRPQVFAALDRLFGTVRPPELQGITVFLRRAQPDLDATVHCDLELTYAAQVGSLTGSRNVLLDVPSAPIAITELALPGPGWVDIDLAETLKGHDLGDNEDSAFAVLPILQQFWNDIGNRNPGAALAWLDTMEDQDQERSKEKIDVLGQSFSGSLTVVLTCLVELCLLLYLAVLLQHVRIQSPGHTQDVAESQFFGIMSAPAGKAVMLVMLLFPLGVCAYSLFAVFPAFAAEWPGPHWQVSLWSRSILTALLALTTAVVLVETRRVLTALPTPPKSPGVEPGAGTPTPEPAAQTS